VFIRNEGAPRVSMIVTGEEDDFRQYLISKNDDSRSYCNGRKSLLASLLYLT
jgi:hypothetical protein